MGSQLQGVLVFAIVLYRSDGSMTRDGITTYVWTLCNKLLSVCRVAADRYTDKFIAMLNCYVNL